MRRVVDVTDLSFALHVAALLVVITLVRPLFESDVPSSVYEGTSIVAALAQADWETIVRAAQNNHPAAPRLLFVLVPTVLLLIQRPRLTWESWEAGKALRLCVMPVVVAFAWAGSTYGYNMYFDQGHAVDRVLLLVMAVLTYLSPIALPPFVTLAVLMIREAAIPMWHDDFDYRAPLDFLVAVSCFIWVSPRRSFKTKHLAFVVVCGMAAYYYAAGRAKLRIGPWGSWPLQDHLSNFLVGARIQGWLGFLPEDAVVKFAHAFRPFDRLLTGFCCLVECGSVLAVTPWRRLTRLFLLGWAMLHVGIIAFTGVFFWKWIVTDISIWYFLSREAGSAIHKQFSTRPALCGLAVFVIVFGVERTWFRPTTGVSWYDSRFNNFYHLIGVDTNGEEHEIDVSTICPMETMLTQGDYHYLSNDPRIAAIYGSTGSYDTYRAFEDDPTPATALKFVNREAHDGDEAKTKKFDDLMSHYFAHVNEHHGWRNHWIRYIGRPCHLCTMRPGQFYRGEQTLTRIDVYRDRILYTDDGLVQIGKRQKIHTVTIPQPKATR